ncbi:MAG: glycosyltransferase [bacterium]
MLNIAEIIQLTSLTLTIAFMIWLGWGLLRKQKGISNRQPFVSVIIAARNEEYNLPRLLECLAAQDYPAESVEFILVNDASTDRTSDIIKSWTIRDSRFTMISLEEDNQRIIGPKKRALTKALEISRAEIIIITDADCAPSQNWIRSTIRCFSEDVQAVTGAVRFETLDNFWSRWTAFEGLFNTILNAAVIQAGGALSCSGANFAFRRAAFEQVGGYDLGGTSFSGDDDLLLQKFHHHKLTIVFNFDQDSRVLTGALRDAPSYWRRRRRHLSAGKHYAQSWVIMAAIVYILSITSVILGGAYLLDLHKSSVVLLNWGVFSGFALILFFLGKKGLGERNWWGWAILTAILLPVLFAFVQPLCLLPSSPWKGRTVRFGIEEHGK